VKGAVWGFWVFWGFKFFALYKLSLCYNLTLLARRRTETPKSPKTPRLYPGLTYHHTAQAPRERRLC